MRIVLDTNVLMSGVFFAGPPSRILAAWADGRLDLLVTVDILAEYQRVATRLSKKYPSVDVASVIDLVIRESRIVEPAPRRPIRRSLPASTAANTQQRGGKFQKSFEAKSQKALTHSLILQIRRT